MIPHTPKEKKKKRFFLCMYGERQKGDWGELAAVVRVRKLCKEFSTLSIVSQEGKEERCLSL